MVYDTRAEYEVRIKGQTLVRVHEGKVKVEGKDFHGDVKNLAALIDILKYVLESAQEAKKPRLVCATGQKENGPRKNPQAATSMKGLSA